MYFYQSLIFDSHQCQLEWTRLAFIKNYFYNLGKKRLLGGFTQVKEKKGRRRMKEKIIVACVLVLGQPHVRREKRCENCSFGTFHLFAGALN